MFRFCVANIFSNHKNMISQRLIVSKYNCLHVRLRTCHTLVETIHHQHGTKGTGKLHLSLIIKICSGIYCTCRCHYY